MTDYEPVNLELADGTFADLGWELVNGRGAVSLAVDDGDGAAIASLTPAEANRLADALRAAASKAVALAS
jgi:hypothetical protein